MKHPRDHDCPDCRRDRLARELGREGCLLFDATERRPGWQARGTNDRAGKLKVGEGRQARVVKKGEKRGGNRAIIADERAREELEYFRRTLIGLLGRVESALGYKTK